MNNIAMFGPTTSFPFSSSVQLKIHNNFHNEYNKISNFLGSVILPPWKVNDSNINFFTVALIHSDVIKGIRDEQ